ncbi:hypothetical protein AZE42_05430 [Rhizopogon vesiculosus]|uniref:Tyrosine specific protein phosphatases domain-containing protein n=1 Tax=Rhizopogon vesiculosus TaxID=180088 RepID=A0A1J8Q8T5_9AGAM|nr:hypothetical protein AZE42_05430 [Rhizopogon vesiculosus]
MKGPVELRQQKRVDKAYRAQSKVSVIPVTSTNPQDAVVFKFTHLLYTTWPDHEVPEDEDQASLLAFVRLVHRVNKLEDTSLLPPSTNIDPDPLIMANSSTGIGRTGSFITISSLLREYHLLSDTPSLNPLAPPPAPISLLPSSPLGPLPKELQEDLIAQEIDGLREQRPGMVPRDEQIHLIYEILSQAFEMRGGA